MSVPLTLTTLIKTTFLWEIIGTSKRQKSWLKVWIERSLNLKFWSRWMQSPNPISPTTPFSFIRIGFRSFWFIGGCPQGLPDIPVSRIRRSKPTCCSRISRLWLVEEKTGKSSPWTGNRSLFNFDFIIWVHKLRLQHYLCAWQGCPNPTCWRVFPALVTVF